MTACLSLLLNSVEKFYVPQVIVDVMAGFKPKPDTRDIRRFCADMC